MKKILIFIILALWSCTFTAQVCNVDTLGIALYDGEPQRCHREIEYKKTSVQAVRNAIAIFKNGKSKIVYPLQADTDSTSAYKFTSIAPDGKHFVTILNDSLLIVCNMSGKPIYRSSSLSAPAWVNKNHIVAMECTRQNNKIERSTIYIINIATGKMQPLSASDLIATYPCAHRDIVEFHTPLYRYTLKISFTK